MSETDQSASAPPVEAATGTNYDLVQKLKADGATREQAIEKLKATGLDDESAKVLVNSVMGALPVDLPSAQLTPGTNALAPNVFTLSDIGLTGPAHVVGLYWMGFGVALFLALGLGTMMTVTGLVQLPELVGEYALRLGSLLGFVCLGWGAFRYFQGITIRRK